MPLELLALWVVWLAILGMRDGFAPQYGRFRGLGVVMCLVAGATFLFGTKAVAARRVVRLVALETVGALIVFGEEIGVGRSVEYASGAAIPLVGVVALTLAASYVNRQTPNA